MFESPLTILTYEIPQHNYLEMIESTNPYLFKFGAHKNVMYLRKEHW